MERELTTLVTEAEMNDIREYLAREFLGQDPVVTRHLWNPFVNLAEAWMLEEYLINGDHGLDLGEDYLDRLEWIFESTSMLDLVHVTAEQKTLGIYLAVSGISYKEWIDGRQGL